MKLVQETDASEVELDKGSTWVPVKSKSLWREVTCA